MQAKLQCGAVTFTWPDGRREQLVATLYLKLEQHNQDLEYGFTCMGDMCTPDGEHRFSGQCLDEMFSCPEMKPYAEIYELWKKWHNNELTPGTPRQMAAVRKWTAKLRVKNGYVNYPSYDDTCAMLKKKNLYRDTKFLYMGKPYEYGTAWLTRAIPQKDLNAITQWIEYPEFNLKKQTKKGKGKK